MLKLIISQLNHSITLILFTSYVSLSNLAGCGPFPLQSLKRVMPALLESGLTSAAVEVREVSLATIMDTDRRTRRLRRRTLDLHTMFWSDQDTGEDPDLTCERVSC